MIKMTRINFSGFGSNYCADKDLFCTFQGGKINRKNVAKLSAVGRQETYRIIDELIQIGSVEKIDINTNHSSGCPTSRWNFFTTKSSDQKNG